MQCKIKFYFSNPGNRINDYLKKYKVKNQVYMVCENASLVGPNLEALDSNLMPIIENFPHKFFFTNTEITKLRNIYRNFEKIYLDFNVCPLFFKYKNFFHWFLDNLPRIFAAENYELLTNEDVFFLVPQDLPEWALCSLNLMNIDERKIIKIDHNKNINCQKLLVRRDHRCNRKLSKYFDVISPYDLHKLTTRLKKNLNLNIKTPKRIFLSRNDAETRKILNQSKIEELLSNFGFQTLILNNIELPDQIDIFHNATHVISPHGAGLTNIMFCQKNASVLEIQVKNHSIRPDFLQIASIMELDYYYECVDSDNPLNNINIPIKTIKKFLDISNCN